MQNFEELNLSPALSNAIKDLGYTAPTPIQAETLPLLLAGPTDFLGLAATGTGKTAAYGIPMLEALNNSRKEVQALVLCPTRELALQVTEQLNLLGKHKKLRAVPIYGGAGYGDQIRGLRQGAQIVVATPGRLIDHLERGTINLEKVQTVILDEADEMISMGFKDELETILENMPSETYNTWLFSATMSRDVRKVADRFLKSPKTVQINKTEMLSGTVRQIYYKVRESDKADILCKLIDAAHGEFYGLIFCQTKSLVADLTTLLGQRGFKIDCLHGDKDQNQRERTMRAFRERKVTILVCTDVASRGLDVKDLTHVINYSIPRELDNYVHRIGRTGRSGKAGLALSLVTPSHMQLIGRIEKMTSSRMEMGAIPTRKEIGLKKINELFERFQGVENPKRVEELLSETWTAALEQMSKGEIASRLLSLTFADVFSEADKAQLPQMPGKPDFMAGGDSRDSRPKRSFRNDRGDRSERTYGGRDSFNDRPVSNEPPSVIPLSSPLTNTLPKWKLRRDDASGTGTGFRRPERGSDGIERPYAARAYSSDRPRGDERSGERLPYAKRERSPTERVYTSERRVERPYAERTRTERPRTERNYGDRAYNNDRPQSSERPAKARPQRGRPW